MSNQKETRRDFIKGSASKALIATNVTVLAGLINTPGVANANSTGGTGQTSVPFTVTANGGTVQPGGKVVKYSLTWQGGGIAYLRMRYRKPGQSSWQYFYWLHVCVPPGGTEDPLYVTVTDLAENETIAETRIPEASTQPWTLP